MKLVCDQSNVCENSIQCGGSVNYGIGYSVTEKGICYSSDKIPTIYDHKIIDKSGNGTFSLTINGLDPLKEYFFRAYVISSAGTIYGNLVYYNPQIIDYDGNSYKTITVGSQTWMAENLRVTHYRNGEPISNVSDNTNWSELVSGAFCSYDNNPENALTYGNLYNYYAVTDNRNICPEGWHIPSESEWEVLINSLGGDSLAGGKLKEKGTDYWLNPNISASDEIMFTALPGGYRTADGIFGGIGTKGSWWTSTRADDKIAWNHDISYNFPLLNIRGSEMKMGLSIRCIKD
jgi:uncharacterized protein (TIGR02145 family)